MYLKPLCILCAITLKSKLLSVHRRIFLELITKLMFIEPVWSSFYSTSVAHAVWPACNYRYSMIYLVGLLFGYRCILKRHLEAQSIQAQQTNSPIDNFKKPLDFKGVEYIELNMFFINHFILCSLFVSLFYFVWVFSAYSFIYSWCSYNFSALFFSRN